MLLTKDAAIWAAFGCLLLCIIMGVMQLGQDPMVYGREKTRLVACPTFPVGPRSGPVDSTGCLAEGIPPSSNLLNPQPHKGRVMIRPVIARARSPPVFLAIRSRGGSPSCIAPGCAQRCGPGASFLGDFPLPAA